ncbi:tachykinin-like peptides receptor 86C [Schistocerca serialis cubense]|uniref:tachykinin-like peptides receptor 86C n=1 Tax=Schistocerca serialis cubense TaxID=2023355 RepID=UPI00214EEC84|nr:tachykinin-like peptides receptor 86C [Schistocerca serialis cubense]
MRVCVLPQPPLGRQPRAGISNFGRSATCSLLPHLYNVVFLCVTYLVPVTAMAVCYGLMGRQLWGDRAIGESTDRQQEAVRSKRKVVRMLVLVVSIFASCWLPYHAYFVYAYHDPAMASSSYAQHLYLCFYWLAMANAGVNPAIYYWMNNRFRMYFQRVLCRIFCCLAMRKHRDAMLGLAYFRNQTNQTRCNSESTRARLRASNAAAQLRQLTQESQLTQQQEQQQHMDSADAS